MAPLTFAVLAFAAVLATACDVSQQKPETSFVQGRDAPGLLRDSAAPDRRSIRAIGPGVIR